VKTRTHRNVTLSLPETVLQRFKVFAASKNQSMSSLMVQAMNKMIAQEPEREAAGRRFIERMRNAPDLGTGGKITWTRDEIHER
jgi:hypothetical protein